MDNKNVMFQDFLKSAHATADRVKQASADTEALYGIKDPADQGKATIPSCGDASNRSSLGLPANSKNTTEPDKEHHIMSVTKPNGVGQGEYETPRCGTSRDEEIKSPTAPINKMAGLANLAAGLRADAEKMAAAAAQKTQEIAKAASTEPASAEPVSPAQEKAAAPAVQLPTQISNDPDLMSKLASMAAVACGSEQGRREFARILEHEAGVKEACALVAQASNAVSEAATQTKQASSGYSYADFQLAEMCKQAHAQWFDAFETDIEKQAYAQGVADADAMADSVDAGGPAELPGAGADGLNDDQIMQVLQELVASGEVSQEEVEAILAALGEGAADGIDPQELAMGIQQAVESGELTPDQAEAIVAMVMGGGEGATPAPEEMVPAGAEEQAAAAASADPTVKAAANQAVEKAASVAKYLWGAK